MRRTLLGLLLIPFAFLLRADTGMGPVAQNAPAQLVSTTHTISDALAAARLENRSGKVLTGYRIGWASVRDGHYTFTDGEWMNIPSGIKPGTFEVVPAQAVPIDRAAQQMLFYVSEIKYQDGSTWKASHRDIVARQK